MKRRTSIAAALAAALLAGVFAAGPASAADGEVSWGVQPSSPAGPDGRSDLSYQVAPGSVVSDWVALTNYSAAPMTFRVYAADATTDYDTASFTLLTADRASTDLGAWTSIDGAHASCTADDGACIAALGREVTLEPGARADIPFTIAVPHDATPGDHSAGIVASYVSAAAAEGAPGVTLEQRVGTRIHLRVDGPLTPGLTLSGAVAGYDGGGNPVAGTGLVGFDLSNTGNTRVSAQPAVVLTGPFGIPLGTVALAPVRDIVPGGTAHVTAELPGVPPLLLLLADVTATPVPADGVAAGDPLPAVAAASVVAWAVPWMLLLALVLVAAVVVLIVWLRRRARARLADDIAAYADEVRAEALREADDRETEGVR
jgi:hypothetical protein